MNGLIIYLLIGVAFAMWFVYDVRDDIQEEGGLRKAWAWLAALICVIIVTWPIVGIYALYTKLTEK